MTRRFITFAAPLLAAFTVAACSTASKPAIGPTSTAAAPPAALAQVSVTPTINAVSTAGTTVAPPATGTVPPTPAAGGLFPATGGGASSTAPSESATTPAQTAGASVSSTPTNAGSGATLTATRAAGTGGTVNPTAPAQPAQAGTATGKPVPTSAPPDTALGASATSAPAAATGAPQGIMAILDAIKLVEADLPAGFSLGSLQAFEKNEQATTGFENPDQVLALMNQTGRAGGYVQQVFTPDGGNGAGVSIEVWNDIAGAATYFSQYPHPAGATYHEITLPQQVGDQVFAYQYTAGAGTGVSVAWRRGRYILGAGEALGADQSLDNLMRLIMIIDRKARAAQ